MPTAEDVAELVAHFAALGRTPRLEYVNPAPMVDAALQAAGFVVEDRLALMSIAPGELVEPLMVKDLDIVLATSDAQLWQAARVQNAAYGEGDATEHDVARLRGTVRGGGGVGLALLDGEPVGAGLFTVPRDGLTEIAAVGVLHRYRRRGIAAALGYRLTRVALDTGAVPYLQAQGDAEQRIYGRLGYGSVGSMTMISRPTSVDVPPAEAASETIESDRLVLYPLTTAAATRIVAGDLSEWTAGDGWPRESTRHGLEQAAVGGLARLITLGSAVIGGCGTTAPVRAGGEVEIWYGLAEPYRGRGYGGEALRAFSHWLFGRPGVRRVVSTVDAGNVPAQRALQRAGFRADSSAGDSQPLRYVLNELPVDEGPPKVIDGERQTLLAFIEYLRGRIAAKVAGLSDVDARRASTSSGTNLLWLVKHVAAVETFWLHYTFAGADPDEVLFDDALTDTDTVAAVLALLDPIAVHSAEIVRGCADLSTLAAHTPFQPARSLRWILVHLIEELGRHAGHADILREQLDGKVGR